MKLSQKLALVFSALVITWALGITAILITLVIWRFF